jgi:phage terminase small subunit
MIVQAKDRRLSVRKIRFAAAILKGRSAVQAAKWAGYGNAYACARSYKIVDRPRVRSFIQQVLDAQGFSSQALLLPILDGLTATMLLKAGQKVVEVTDHRMRFAAVELALRALSMKESRG